jgi:hypothetical protein
MPNVWVTWKTDTGDAFGRVEVKEDGIVDDLRDAFVVKQKKDVAPGEISVFKPGDDKALEVDEPVKQYGPNKNQALRLTWSSKPAGKIFEFFLLPVCQFVSIGSSTSHARPLLVCRFFFALLRVAFLSVLFSLSSSCPSPSLSLCVRLSVRVYMCAFPLVWKVTRLPSPLPPRLSLPILLPF